MRKLGSPAVFGGLAAVVAGLCWVVKAGSILVTGIQPPLVFEVAPLLMAAGVLGLARQAPVGRPRRVGSAVAAVALLASIPEAVSELWPLPATLAGITLAGSTLLVLAGLVLLGADLRRRVGARLPLALGLATLPAIIAGGLLAMFLGERLLELPLLVLGVAWTTLGVRMLQERYRTV